MSRRTIPFLQTMRRLLFVYLVGAGLTVGLFVLTSLFRLLTDATPYSTKPADTVETTVDLHHPALFGPVRGFVTELKSGFERGEQTAHAASPKQPPPPAASGKAGFQLVADQERQLLRYRETSSWKRLALLQLGVIYDDMSLGFALYLLLSGVLLYRIVRDVTPETPFTAANARRIRWLGLLLIAADAYQQLVYALLPLLVPSFREAGTGKLLSQYLVLTPRIEYGDWAIGLMLLIIAAVYRRGVDLTREAELTV